MLVESNVMYTFDEKEALEFGMLSFSYQRLHIPTVVPSWHTAYCISEANFHKLLAAWNGRAPGTWQYIQYYPVNEGPKIVPRSSNV